MKRHIFVLRSLLAIIGILFLLMSGVVVVTSSFGTSRFLTGIALHLLAQGLCISALCLPGWLTACHNALLARQQPDFDVPLSHAPPRVAHFHMGTQAMRLFYGLALVLLIGFGLIANGIHLNNLLRLHRQGVLTNATITGTSFREGKSLLKVTYAFTTNDDMPVVDSFQAPRARLREMRTGTSVPITYLPQSPDVHTRQTVDNRLILQHTLSGMLLFIASLVYVGFPILVMEGRVRRQLSLVRTGLAVTGTITTCKPLVWHGKRYGYWLTFTFPLSDSALQSSQAFVEHVPGEPTLPGFPITVLYDPAQPATNRPLSAFPAVRMTVLRKSIQAA